jgi:hypothetical protein
MKKILCLALLVLVFSATGICTAKVPDLIGKWTGFESWYGEVNGSAKLTENKSLNVAIVDQKNRLVTGNMTYKLENGTEVVEGFAGAIGLDNKTLYLAEFNEGYDLGTIISNDEIELIYLQDGKMAEATIGRLHLITAYN